MLRRIGLLLLAGLALVPTPLVAGQFDPVEYITLNLEVQPHGAPIAPATGVGNASIEATIQCGPFSWTPIQPETLELWVHPNQSWTTATLSAQTTPITFSPGECATGSIRTLHFEAQVTFTSDAPAFGIATYHLTAQFAGTQATASWQERAGAYMQANAEMSPTTYEAQPGEAFQLDVMVTNDGNGPITAIFSLGSATGDALSLIVPPPITVLPFGETGTASLSIQAPTGYDDARRDPLVLLIDSHSTHDTSVTGRTITLNGAVETAPDNGAGLPAEELPGPGIPVLALLAAIAAALVARRRS